jgi:gamma-glutamyltranspeptidase/glutathione hydrolase
MRDFQLPGRSAVYGDRVMAATSHPLATLAAVDCLKVGGNAVDAAITAVAVQCVVEPHMTGIGGDCFALVRPPEGGVVALNGSGCAPAALSTERLIDAGLSEIGPASVHAVTVPGAVAAWGALLERYGSRSLDDVLRPAVDWAERGFRVLPRVAWDWARSVDTLRRSATAGGIYLPGDHAPAVGDLVRLPLLAETLRALGRQGARAFYEGELAAQMVAALKAHGGLHEEADFAAQTAEFVAPIRTSYRGVEVYECPPNGQGVAALMMLNVLSGFPPADDPLGRLRFHLQIEASRLVYRDRDALVGDPAQADVPVEALLSVDYAADLRALIDPDGALQKLPPPLSKPHPSTVYLTVVDADGMAVSLINSIFDSFGSGLACPETGVLFHNRGQSFVLDPGHPNALAPGKRPLHTIIPAMAEQDGRLWASFGVMGGHYQAVGHAHVVTGTVDYGLDPQQALDAPRVFARGDGVVVERGVPAATVQGLAALGHPVIAADKPLGGGQMIRLDAPRGVLIGGSDPRKDGCALGF